MIHRGFGKAGLGGRESGVCGLRNSSDGEREEGGVKEKTGRKTEYTKLGLVIRRADYQGSMVIGGTEDGNCGLRTSPNGE